MGLINVASGASCWRGHDYYLNKKIKNFKQISNHEYETKVIGSNNQEYNVFIDIEKPRSSKCNCPHAKDKRIICKHMIALYFTVFPKEADNFVKEVEDSQKEYEEYMGSIHEKVNKRIKSMSKSELQESLTHMINIAPEWVYERFIRDYVGW